MRFLDAEKAVITANKVLLRVKAAGLNLADLKVIKGGVGRFLHANKFPLFLGYDFSGIVESIRVAFLEMGMSGPNGIEVMTSVWNWNVFA